MDLQLSRSELSNIGPVSARDTIKLLPFGTSKCQSVVVGDDSGSVSCFSTNRGETKTNFRTSGYGSEIQALALGGTDTKDKIFFSTGQHIYGVNKKGKEFFSFQTNLSENVERMHVHGSQLWTSGNLTYTKFNEGQEVESQLFDDSVDSLAVGDVTGNGELLPVVGNKDGNIRVLRDGKVVARKSVGTPVTALAEYSMDANPNTFSSEAKADHMLGQPQSRMLYGTFTGKVGEVSTRLDPSNGLVMQNEWEIPNFGNNTGGVNVLVAHDLTKDDCPDVVVGRDDGTLQVYSLGIDAEPRLQFRENVNESIRGMQVGVINTPGYDEVILCTYSGNLLSYSTEGLDQVDENDASNRTKLEVNREGTLHQLRGELGDLQKQLDQSKRHMEPLLGKESGTLLPASHQFKVNSKLVLQPDEAAYHLICEIPVSIDVVAIESSLALDLIDHGDDQPAIVSVTPPQPGSTSKLSAVYRFTEPSKRAQIKFRTSEGEYGDIKTVVVAKLKPKTASHVVFNIKPLSLHHRIPFPQERTVPTSKLSLTGQFSLDRVHEWLKACVPGVPERPSLDELPPSEGKADDDDSTPVAKGPSASLAFENAFVHSMLFVSYSEGDIVFESDSLSTLAILREFFTAEAGKRNTRVNIRYQINPETVPHFLKVIDQKLSYQTALARKGQLLEALREIETDKASDQFLSPEYRDILKHASSIKQELESRPRVLHALFGIVTDLFVDLQKFKGRNVNNSMTHSSINQILQNYNFQDLLRFFEQAQ